MNLIECDCTTDWHGQSVGFVATPNGRAATTPQGIYKALWNEYNLGGCGYKFAMVIDLSTDEYVEPEKDVNVYFLCDILPEVIDYCGTDEVLREIGLDKVIAWLEKKGVKVK